MLCYGILCLLLILKMGTRMSEMASAGVRPTEATLVTVISALADIAALLQGTELISMY
jgi:hypothetical protein